MSTYVDLFYDAVCNHKDKVALKDKYAEYTYQELHQKSNILAHHLLELLNNPQDQKAICILAGRNAYQIISTLAVMKAGMIQVPIDITHPNDRIGYILKDTESVLLLTTHQIMNEKELVLPNTNIFFLDEFNFLGDHTDVNHTSDDMIIDILFTSGTTGKPKGVIRSHRVIYHCVKHITEFFEAEDKVLSLTNFTFAASYLDIYTPFAAGVSVYLMEGENRTNIGCILNYIYTMGITAMFAPPQLGCVLLDKFDVPLRMLAMGGDAILPFSNKKVIVYNGYGMTEYYLVGLTRIEDGMKPELPLCVPFEENTVRIVDESGNDVEEGEIGELIIKGPMCFDGYLGDASLTKSKITDGYFHTGDYVKEGKDGCLYYVNRSNDMIKINGQRIAPCEVETVAIEKGKLRDAVCVSKEVYGISQLCLYYLDNDEMSCDIHALREEMAKKLKPYMIPAIFIKMDAFPLNANGKTDRKALPEPEQYAGLKNEKPRNVNEAILLDIAHKVLERDDFGVTDNLILLGMDSLRAMEIVAAAEEKRLIIKINDLLKHENIRSLVDAGMSIVYAQNETYDETLPTVVLVCGITSFNNLHYMTEELKKCANLYVIEPIKSHYDIIFRDESMNEVVDFYYEVLDYYLDGKKVDGFIGHCYGGEIAYRMAVKWQKEHSGKLALCVLDSPWHEKPDHVLADVLHALPLSKLPDSVKWTVKEVDMINNLAVPADKSFDGAIVYFKALQKSERNDRMLDLVEPEIREAYEKECRENGYVKGMIDPKLWMNNAPSVEVVYIDGEHVSMLQEQYIPGYLDKFFALMGRTR